MIGAVETGNISALRLFNATNAFGKSNPQKPEMQAQQISDVSTDVIENSILKNVDVEEIKQFASSVGENNLSDEDIKYGLRFGRSVLVDYSA